MDTPIVKTRTRWVIKHNTRGYVSVVMVAPNTKWKYLNWTTKVEEAANYQDEAHAMARYRKLLKYWKFRAEDLSLQEVVFTETISIKTYLYPAHIKMW